MLLQFSVENFLSFKEKAILSLIPSKDKIHNENIISSDGFSALCSASITGANASGKSSLLKAISTAVHMIRTSNMLQPMDGLPYQPFKFVKDAMSIPTSFEFVFIGEDSKKYIYGFSYLLDRIVDEYLYVYSSRRPTLIFDRKNTNGYDFTSIQKRMLEPITNFTTINKLFLSTASAWNYQIAGNVIKWLLSKINVVANLAQLNNFALDLYRQDYNNKTKNNLEFAAKLLQSADINITNIDLDFKETPAEMIPTIKFNNITLNPASSFQFNAITTHAVQSKDSDQEEKYPLNLIEESAGTQQLFFLAPIIKKILDNGEILVIDEIEKGLHPFIVDELIEVFKNPEFNKKNAQLVYTTHNTQLLDLKTFRRDQIYFTEKNSNTGESILFSLDDFSVRNTEDIQKGYLLGRYGAIPNIKGELFRVT